MDILTLIKLAEEFGLPSVEREETITIVGEKQLLIFNKVEKHQCQIMEIY